ncbi:MULTISPECIES: AEC family transporter [unclassified Lentimicrobium]|uniref:AEC family transporter n=1 Tax=unclassified Lentimicrobium TaxID=2677434 RepID=UPI001555819D|nr:MULTISPECIES: AEC family transporter [unclassified Lentimicrobium]NPD48237.1 hypothetical protein [Lentimicrobium sp. S6]NPD86308.1 hypothetical protein [Lentimicrobium sp. L6]
MNETTSLLEGVLVIIAIIFLTTILKKFKILKKEDSKFFANIVLKVTLPAIIFSTLALHTFNVEFLWMALIMATIELLILGLAWLIASLFKFNSGEKGALMLVSAFGMTSMLGYPLIQQIFPGNAMAIEEAVVTSEFGVGLLLFILGPLIAMIYGDAAVKGSAISRSVKQFFASPIFFALVFGFGMSFLPINQTSFAFKTATNFLSIVGAANFLLVGFTIGLIIEFKRMSHVFLFMAIAVLLKLILKPVLAVVLTNSPEFTSMMREIVFIETALPSAILTAVFAKQYNCRPDLVSMAIMVTLVLSVISVSGLFVAFF